MEYKGLKIAELRKMVKESQPKPKTMKRSELVSMLSAASMKAMEPSPREEPVEMPSKVVKSAVVEEKAEPKVKKTVKIVSSKKEEPKKEAAKKKEAPKKSTHGDRVREYMSKHKGCTLAEASKAVSEKK